MEFIASGSYGSVYRTTMKRKIIAIKRMSISLENYAINEVKAYQRMKSHRNISSYVGYKKSIDFFDIYLEYIDGRELFVIVGRCPLTEQYCRDLFQQMVDGVEHMHNHNILHRDLKLENCLVVHGRHIKWVDFGLCYIYKHEGEILKKSCGSLYYSAPEVLNCRYTGYQSDIWSLGICLFSMLFTFFPFERADLPETIAILETEDIVKTVCIKFGAKLREGNVTNLITQMLRFHPSERLNIYNIKQHAWMMQRYDNLIVHDKMECVEDFNMNGKQCNYVNNKLRSFKRTYLNWMSLLKSKCVINRQSLSSLHEVCP